MRDLLKSGWLETADARWGRSARERTCEGCSDGLLRSGYMHAVEAGTSHRTRPSSHVTTHHGLRCSMTKAAAANGDRNGSCSDGGSRKGKEATRGARRGATAATAATARATTTHTPSLQHTHRPTRHTPPQLLHKSASATAGPSICACAHVCDGQGAHGTREDQTPCVNSIRPL